MPYYEYECDNCCKWTEKLSTVDNMLPEVPCYFCGEIAQRRIRSVPHVVGKKVHVGFGEYRNMNLITGKPLRKVPPRRK